MASVKMSLELVTAQGPVLSTETHFLLAPGIDGDLGILANHVPLLTPLRTGAVVVRNGDAEENIFVSGGFLEVTGTKVVILADVAERAQDIDANRAEAARKAAEEALRGKKTDAEAAAALERAVYRLRLADLHDRRRSRS